MQPQPFQREPAPCLLPDAHSGSLTLVLAGSVGARSHVNELLWWPLQGPVLIGKICHPWLLRTNEIQEERISRSLLAMGSVCRGLKTPEISQDRGIFPWLSA